MKEVILKVQGSTSQYKLTFSKGTKYVKVACSCPAGTKAFPCKHRKAVLAGDYSCVENKEALPDVDEMISTMVGPEFRDEMRTYYMIEDEMEKLKATKKSLSEKYGDAWGKGFPIIK